MAQKDTQLLGEILSTQKALLKHFQEKEKKGEKGSGDDAGKASATVEKGGGLGGFGNILKELQTLNETSKKQLEVLERIDKNVAGGMAAGGDTSIIKAGSGADLGELGAGMVSFSLGLLALVGGIVAIALVLPLVPIAMISAVGIGLIVAGMAKLFEWVGSDAMGENVEKGNENVLGMAKGLALFTLAVIASSLAVSQVGFGALGMLAITLMGFGGVFYLIGKGSDTIEDGAYAAMKMGLGMASLAIGIVAMAIAIKYTGELLSDGGSALVGGLAAFAILAVAGVTFYIMGQAAKEIAMGSLAAAAIGLGLAVFGMGLTVYLSGIAKIMGVGGKGTADGTKVTGGFFDTLGSMLVGLGIIATGAVTLMLYGSIFALAGLFELGVPLMIAAGAGAFALAGLSLMVFGFGLDSYLGVIAKHIGVSGEGAGMNITAKSFTSGFVTMGGAIGMLIGIGATMALAGLASPLILLGAAAIAASGYALDSLGYGIKQYTEQAGGTDIGDDLKENLGKIRDAFLTFVGEEDMADKGIFGSLGSLITGGATAGTLAAALATAMLIGPALSSIAQGVGIWADLQNMPKIIGYDKEGQPIFDESNTADVETALDNMTTYLPGIVEPFIQISNRANMKKGTSLFSLISGADLGESPFEEGVRVAGQIGPTLTALAAGLGTFADLTQAPKITGYDKMGQPIFSPDQTFDVTAAMPQISETLTMIVEPFIQLANRANLKKGVSLFSLISGGDLGESPFEMGVRIAGQIGPTLTALAGGIGTYADLSQAPKITGYDKMGQPIYSEDQTFNVLDAIPQISETVTQIVEPFIQLANRANLKKGTSLFSLISGGDLGESPFEMGVRIAGNIGPTLTALAGGIGTFADLTQAPKIVGYDELGQPIYSEDETFDVTAGIDGLAETLEIIIEPFLKLANAAALKKGTSLFSLISGADLGSSPFEMAVNIVGQMGPMLTSLAGGLGSFADLAQAKKIVGYDQLGQPIYSESETFNVTEALKNMTYVIDPDSSDSIIAPLIKLGDYLQSSKPFSIGGFISEAIMGVNPAMSPAEKGMAFALQIGRVLTEIGNGLGVFVNLNNIPEILKYDEEGHPVYSGKSVDSQKAIANIGKVLSDIIGTISGNAAQLEKLGGGGFLGFGKGKAQKGAEAIGPMVASLLNGISTSLEAFASPNNIKSIVGYDEAGKAKYSPTGVNIYEVMSTMDYVLWSIIRTVGNQAENLEKLYYAGEGANAISKLLSSFVKPIKTFAETMGIASQYGGMTHAINVFNKYLTNTIMTLALLYDEGKTSSAQDSAEDMEDIAASFNGKILEFIKNMVQVDMVTFNVNSLFFFDSIKTLATINGGDKKKRTFFAQFNDEITRLSSITSPFGKFVKEFGKFAEHMGTFKENFSFMNPDGINAFEKWTMAIEHLVITADEAGVTSGGGGMLNTVVEKTGDLISTAFGIGDKGTDMNAAKKGEQIKKANAGGEGGGKKEAAAPQVKIDYAALGKAVAAALTSAELNVVIVADDSSNRKRKR